MKFYLTSRKKGANKQQEILDSFWDAFSTCNLHDMGFSGYEFTWWYKRDGDQSVEECFDQFCATIKWSLLFPSANVIHMDAKLSDHLPIQLKLSGINHNSRKSGRRGFKFENMWAPHDECGEIVKNVWKEHAATCNIVAVEKKSKTTLVNWLYGRRRNSATCKVGSNRWNYPFEECQTLSKGI